MNKHNYTDKEKRFMEYYVPGHSYKEIQKAFAEKFGWEITLSQVNSYIGNHKLITGLTGRFNKGHVPVNKGKKGISFSGSEKGWFKKGNIPSNHRPIGSERISKDGYTEVKVEEPNKWKLKHRLVWESMNGKIPKGHIVIFRDGDKQNLGIENLILIKRSVNAVLNHTGLHEYTEELKDVAIHMAELKIETAKAKKRVIGADNGRRISKRAYTRG